MTPQAIMDDPPHLRTVTAEEAQRRAGYAVAAARYVTRRVLARGMTDTAGDEIRMALGLIPYPPPEPVRCKAGHLWAPKPKQRCPECEATRKAQYRKNPPDERTTP